jgi:hypothetical protein
MYIFTYYMKNNVQIVISTAYAFSVAFFTVMLGVTASVVWWSEFLATYPEVPGSIPGPTRFSEN